MNEKDLSREIKGRIEASLFVATKAVSTKAVARGLDLPEPQAEELLRELAHDLEAPNQGVRLRNVAGRWRGKPIHAI
jgi:chromosome segregation and condensation protein ScpB